MLLCKHILGPCEMFVKWVALIIYTKFMADSMYGSYKNKRRLQRILGKKASSSWTEVQGSKRLDSDLAREKGT